MTKSGKPPHSAIPASPSALEYAAMQSGLHADSDKLSEDMFKMTEPYGLFDQWLRDAVQAEPSDPNAMSLATVNADGVPDVRIVLLKAVDARGFVFYTNSESTKGQDLQCRPQAALCFHWKSLERSVRIRGDVQPVSSQESNAYFSNRSRGSQIGAWASQQSAHLASRQILLDAVETVKTKYRDQDVPRPPHWYGWRVRPQTIEFWLSRPFRLHDRLVYSKVKTEKEEKWDMRRLFP